MQKLTQHPKKNDILSNGDVIQIIKKKPIRQYNTNGSSQYVMGYFLCVLSAKNHERVRRYYPSTMQIGNYEKSFCGVSKGSYFKEWNLI